MTCEKCGRTIKADFTICPYCGSTIQAAEGPVAEHTFSVAGRTIAVPDSLVKYNALRKRFSIKAEELENEYIEFYRKRKHNFSGLFDEEIPEVVRKVVLAVKFGVSVLMEYGIDDIDEDELSERVVSANGDIKQELEPIYAKVAEIIDFEESLSEYRNAQRMGRSQWEGGGFGVGGAIKGALTAGALNMGTNIFRGIGDSITNSSDKAKISKLKQELVTDPKTFKLLRDTLYKQAFSVFYCVKDILISEHIVEPLTFESKRAIARARNNVEQYKDQKENEAVYNRTMDVLCECVLLAPYSTEIYYHLYTYTTAIADKTAVHTMARYFGIERSYKKWLIKADTNLLNMIKEGNEDTVEDIIRKIDDLTLLLQENPYIKENEYLEELKEKLKDYECITAYQTAVDSAVAENSLDLLWQYADGGNVYAEEKLFSYYCSCGQLYKENRNKLNSLLQELAEKMADGNHLAAFILARLGNETKTPGTIQLVQECYKTRTYALPIYYAGLYKLNAPSDYNITSDEAVRFIDRAASMFFPPALNKAYDLFEYGKWFVVKVDEAKAARYNKLRKLYTKESLEKNIQIQPEEPPQEDLAVYEETSTDLTDIQQQIQKICFILTCVQANMRPTKLEVVPDTKLEATPNAEKKAPITLLTSNIMSTEQLKQPSDHIQPPPVQSREEIITQATQSKAENKPSKTAETIVPDRANIIGKSKILAGILAIILGTYGVHWFYLRNPKRGLIYLVVLVASFFAAVVFPGFFFAYLLFCIGEGLFFLFSKRESFERYVCKQKNRRH